MRIEYLWLLALVMSAPGHAGPNDPTTNPLEPAPRPPIQLGILLPPDEPEARCISRAATLTADLLSAETFSQIQVVIRGRSGQWGDDGVEAARLALDDGVFGLVAPPSGTGTHLVLQVAGRTAVPVVSLCGDSSVTGAGIPWMAQIVPGTRQEAAWLLHRSPGSEPNGRCCAFVPAGRPGREFSSDLAAAATDAGRPWAQTIEVPAELADFSILVKPMATHWPALVALWLDPEPAALLAKALRAAGYTGAIVGPGRLESEEFVHAAGSSAEGFLVPAVAGDVTHAELRRSFAESYSRRFGAAPDAMARMSSDAIRVLAARAIASNAAKSTERSAAWPSQEGLSGHLLFGEDGSRRTHFTLRVCRQGRFEDVPPEPPTSAIRLP